MNITEAAGNFQHAFISYSTVTALVRFGLETDTCEGYVVVKKELNRLALAKNHRFVAMHQYAVFQVVAQAAREHGFFDVFAIAHHVFY